MSSLLEKNKLIAPDNKFKVIAVDTFEGPYADYELATVSSLEIAKEIAIKHGAKMNPVYVYNDKGKCVFNTGEY